MIPVDTPAPPRRFSRMLSAFTPPDLPPASRRAFRFHMAYTLLDAVSAGILSNAPVMAVKAMHATDAQLQLPQAMTSLGLFASIFTGAAMATRQKRPFVVVPGILSGIAALLMAWTGSALWFLAAAGVIQIFDFAIRPAIPSILRSIYPEHCRAHVAGTLRQYASVVFLCSTLFFASLLSASSNHIWRMIRIEITLAGVSTLAAFLCFRQLPNHGDGSAKEAAPIGHLSGGYSSASLEPWKDRQFRRYLAIFFLFASGNLFFQGIVPAFFATDLGYGYVRTTLLIHIVPAITAFLIGGRLTAWFDRTSVWRSYAFVALLWGLDPMLLALMPFAWPVVWVARMIRGPATVGSIVLAYYTGVHSFSRPGPGTSFYMTAFILVNGLARLIAPTATALVSGHMSHRTILFCGALGVLAASACFRLCEGRDDASGR